MKTTIIVIDYSKEKALEYFKENLHNYFASKVKRKYAYENKTTIIIMKGFNDIDLKDIKADFIYINKNLLLENSECVKNIENINKKHIIRYSW